MVTKSNNSPTKRATRQRAVIRQTLEQARRPLSPQEIHGLASREHTGISIATIYRAVRDLEELGEIAAVDLPGEASRYEIAVKLGHHHHFQCDLCKRVFEVQGCPGDMSEIMPASFHVKRHSIVLYGDCPDCKSPDKPHLVSGPRRKR